MAALGEGEVGGEDEGEGDGRDPERAAVERRSRPGAARPQRPDQDDAGEEGGGDRAGEGASRGGEQRQLAAPQLQGAQRGEGEGDAEGEGELAVGEQGDDAGREPERPPARRLAPAVADEAVEEVGGGDDRERADQLRSEHGGQRREEEAVGEGVVAAVPAAVPDRQAGALEQLSAEDLGGEVADLRVPGQHREREQGAEGDGGEPVGS